MSAYLQPGLPIPVASADGLDASYWTGLRDGVLRLQRCRACERFQWGPEWCCNRCHSFDMGFDTVLAEGILYSHQRVWHPVHPALANQGAYVIALVELPHADNVRLVGNLLGDPMQELTIGSPVRGVYEHHEDSTPGFTLLHWEFV